MHALAKIDNFLLKRPKKKARREYKLFDECSLRICVKTTRHTSETENKHFERTLSDDKLTFSRAQWRIIVTSGDRDINGAFVL